MQRMQGMMSMALEQHAMYDMSKRVVGYRAVRTSYMKHLCASKCIAHLDSSVLPFMNKHQCSTLFHQNAFSMQ